MWRSAASSSSALFRGALPPREKAVMPSGGMAFEDMAFEDLAFEVIAFKG